MYGYDYYGYDPATEGFGDTIKSLGEKALNVIKGFGKWLAGVIKGIGNFLRGKGSTKEVESTDNDATALVRKILDKSENMIMMCAGDTDTVYSIYQNFVAMYKKYGKTEDLTDENEEKLKDRMTASVRLSLKERGIDKDNYDPNSDMGEYKTVAFSKKFKSSDDKDLKEVYKKNLAELQQQLLEQAQIAKSIKSDFADLKSKQKGMSYDTMKVAYEQLSKIYGANNKFANEWARIKQFKEGAPMLSKLKSYLSKIFSVYDVGKRAVESIGNRLVKIEAYGDNRKFKTAEAEAPAATGNTESVDVVLSSIYDAAYEAAYNDIMEQQRAMDFFDSIPEYEF